MQGYPLHTLPFNKIPAARSIRLKKDLKGNENKDVEGCPLGCQL